MKLRLFRHFARYSRPDKHGRILVTSRRIYVLPTAYGYTFGVVLLAMLLGAINYANNLGFMLTFLLTGIGLVSIIHTWHNLLGLQLHAVSVEPVFAGQQVCFNIQLLNHRTGSRPGIQLNLKGSETDIVDLPAAASGTLCCSFDTVKRGQYSLPVFTIATTYPLGLIRAWTQIRLDTTFLVYPAPGPRMPTSAAPDYTLSAQGDKGVGADDFVGLRQYRPGDSPKHLSWKALAREQELQTKMFGGDRAERCWLDLDRVSGDLETRLSGLCRGVLDACEQQFEYGLRLAGEQIAPSRGENHKRKCLEALARFGEAR